MLSNRRNHYRMLYVQPDAPFEIIRANYRTLMQKLKLHPDLGGEHWNAVFVNEAYATLCDPVKRAAYDIELLKRYDMETISRGSLGASHRPQRQPVASAGNQRNFYRILQVQPDAPLEVIEASHRALVAEGTVPAAPLEEAFATLHDSARRQAYDRDLKESGHLEAVARATAAMRGELAAGDLAAPQQRVGHPSSGYDPVITRYCLFCKTPHHSSASILEEAGCTECGSPLFAPLADFLVQARRTLGRSAQNEDIAYYTFWPGKRFIGHMVDLSPTGLRLLTPESCEVGDILKIDARRLQAVGAIVHLHRDGAGTTAGIKFHTVGFRASRGSFLSARA
jgi:hypothetical protein